MGEFGYMEDTEHISESDVYTLYLHSFANEISESEKIKELAKIFNFSEEKIASIVKTDELKNEVKYSSLDYLKGLSTKQLDGIHRVLISQGKTTGNAEIINNIEKITKERIKTNE